MSGNPPIATTPLWFNKPGPFAPECCKFVGWTEITVAGQQRPGHFGLKLEIPRADGEGAALLILPLSPADLGAIHESLKQGADKAYLTLAERTSKPSNAN
jgi:hypothetical protein